MTWFIKDQQVFIFLKIRCLAVWPECNLNSREAPTSNTPLECDVLFNHIKKTFLCYIHWPAHMACVVRSSICPRKWFTHWGGQLVRRHRSLCEHVLQRLSLPACLPAWGQLGSRALRSEGPLASPDWLESHLPNRLAPCHQTVEQQRGLGGVEYRERALIWQRETGHKCWRKRKKNVSAHVCQMITITL